MIESFQKSSLHKPLLLPLPSRIFLNISRHNTTIWQNLIQNLAKTIFLNLRSHIFRAFVGTRKLRNINIIREKTNIQTLRFFRKNFFNRFVSQRFFVLRSAEISSRTVRSKTQISAVCRSTNNQNRFRHIQRNQPRTCNIRQKFVVQRSCPFCVVK